MPFYESKVLVSSNTCNSPQLLSLPRASLAMFFEDCSVDVFANEKKREESQCIEQHRGVEICGRAHVHMGIAHWWWIYYGLRYSRCRLKHSRFAWNVHPPATPGLFCLWFRWRVHARKPSHILQPKVQVFHQAAPQPTFIGIVSDGHWSTSAFTKDILGQKTYTSTLASIWR